MRGVVGVCLIVRRERTLIQGFHMIKRIAMTAAILAALPMLMAFSAPAGHVQDHAVRYAAILSPQQRGAAIGTFVRRWGPYAQQVYGVDVRTWSLRLVGQFAQGDAVNIQRALARTTFEGAMSELAGLGHRSTDAQVISKLASLSGVRAGTTTDVVFVAPSDLVFTPIAPCRVADTRNAGGQIPANTNRGFNSHGLSSYASFGGSATDCGLQSQSPKAVVLNVTAVLPAAAGYATVYSGELASPPGVSSINYAINAIVNNNVVVALNPAGTTPDYRIYTLRTSHYVVDVVGYYDAPHATALDCVTVLDTSVVNVPASSNAFYYSTASCPANYAESSPYCYSAAKPEIYSGGSGINPSSFCQWINLGTTSQTVYDGKRCCRVPGR